MRATFDHTEDITPTIKTFWFAPEQPVRYIAGQFTELYLPHEADNRGPRRWFTLSSSPTEKLLGITTRIEQTSRSSFKHQLINLRPGTKLHLADPMGDFVLPKNPDIPLVFVAAGLGITPVRSMVKWLQDKDEQRTIMLLYAVSQTEDLAFVSLFNSHELSFQPIIASRDGHITPDAILQATADMTKPLIYISGPELLVETLVKQLQRHGIEPSRLVGDYFPGYTP